MNGLEQSPGISSKARVAALLGQNPPWKARSVWLAAALAVVGAMLWVKDVGQPVPPPSTSSPGRSEFAGDAPKTDGPREAPTTPKPRLPAMLRLGASYLAGFFLGWSLRRFVKVTLLISGAIIALIVVARKLGWMDVDWAGIEDHVRSGVSSVESEVVKIKHLVTGFLPSAGGAGLGLFFGFRRK